MPRARHARDKRSRSPKSRRGEDSSLLLDIEESLRDARHYVEALRLIGHGLVLHDELDEMPALRVGEEDFPVEQQQGTERGVARLAHFAMLSSSDIKKQG